MNIFKFLFGKKSNMAEIKKEYVPPATPSINVRKTTTHGTSSTLKRIPPYTRDSRLYDDVDERPKKRDQRDDLSFIDDLPGAIILMDEMTSDSPSNDSQTDQSTGFDGGFGGGGFSGGGAGGDWSDSPSSSDYSSDSSSDYSSSDSSSSDY